MRIDSGTRSLLEKRGGPKTRKRGQLSMMAAEQSCADQPRAGSSADGDLPVGAVYMGKWGTAGHGNVSKKKR